MKDSPFHSKKFCRWCCWVAVFFTVMFCVLILPALVRKARLISHVNEVGGFFYSYHSPRVRKLLGSNFYKIKGFLVPKLEPVLGREWPGIFKEITHVEIDLRNGGSTWDLECLRKQNDLQWVDIGSLPVGNSEAEVLETLPSLTQLCINISRIDSEGIARVADLKELRALYLRGRKITEEEARLLSRLGNLSVISLIESQLEGDDPSASIRILEEQLPQTRIVYGGYFSP